MGIPGYFEFFGDQDQAIAHCRKRNAGLSSRDPRCYAVVDGPGCSTEEHPSGCTCCDYAVVDLETAKELTDDAKGAPYLIVT
jgi:hypothetical protein